MLISDVVLLASRLYIYHYHTRADISVTPASHQHYPVGSIGQQIEKKNNYNTGSKTGEFHAFDTMARPPLGGGGASICHAI